MVKKKALCIGTLQANNQIFKYLIIITIDIYATFQKLVNVQQHTTVHTTTHYSPFNILFHGKNSQKQL